MTGNEAEQRKKRAPQDGHVGVTATCQNAALESRRERDAISSTSCRRQKRPRLTNRIVAEVCNCEDFK